MNVNSAVDAAAPTSSLQSLYGLTPSADNANATDAVEVFNSDGSFNVTLDAATRKSIAAMAEHGSNAYLKANAAIDTMNQELGRMKHSIAVHRPDLDGSPWDFVMKDGRLKVSGGDLNEADTRYVEHRLNADGLLVNAVKSFNAAAVSNLQTSDDNPAGSYLSPYTGHLENRTFYKVADQMNGMVNYGALLEHTKRYAQIDKSGSAANEAINLAQMGSKALDVLASQLTPSNNKISMYGYVLDPNEGTLGPTESAWAAANAVAAQPMPDSRQPPFVRTPGLSTMDANPASTTVATATLLNSAYGSSPDSAVVIASQDGVFISLNELAAKSAESSAKHGADAYLKANFAIDTMNKELAHVKHSIGAVRPDLKDSSWDFVMKDGKLKVSTDNLSKADTEYVERRLNGDIRLVHAIKSFNAAAVLNLQTSKDNPGVNYLSPYSGHMENRTFYKVADQMNGKVNYGALLENTKKYLQIDKSGSAAAEATNLAQMGPGALDVLASLLKPSHQLLDKFGFRLDPIE